MLYFLRKANNKPLLSILLVLLLMITMSYIHHFIINKFNFGNGGAVFLYSICALYGYKKYTNKKLTHAKTLSKVEESELTTMPKTETLEVVDNKPNPVMYVGSDMVIPESAISIKSTMKYVNKGLRYYFYLYNINGVEYVKPVKVEYTPYPSGHVKRIQTTLPTIKGSLHNAMREYLDKKQTPKNDEKVTKVETQQISNKVEKFVEKPIQQLEKVDVETTKGTLIYEGIKEFTKTFKGVTTPYESYCCEIRTSAGTLDVLKGVDLKHALESANAKLGDLVEVSKSTKKTINESGKPSFKNLYSIKVY